MSNKKNIYASLNAFLISFSCLYLYSCSTLPTADPTPSTNSPLKVATIPTVNWSLVQGKPQWFQVPFRFTPYANQDDFIHPFFDLEPMLDYLEKTVNFFVINPADSIVTKGFDLISGRLYKKHDNCAGDDLWKGSSNVPINSPYTEGIVPRILDQSGGPLKIIIFGREKFYQEYISGVSHQGRVIGAMVEQYCQTPPCEKGKGWESKMVLIAVDPSDEKYQNIKTITDLKEEVNWDEVMAFWQNTDGVGKWLNKSYPLTRVIGNITSDMALKMTTSKTKVFSSKELNEIRKACFKLYDVLWNNIGNFKTETKQIQKKLNESGDSRKNINSILELTKTKDFKMELEAAENLQSFKKYEKNLVKRILSFNKNYGKQFTTCTNFVYSSNILDNFHRHWFFTYYTLVYKLFNLEYYYDCWGQEWRKNIRMSLGNFKKKRENILDGCSASQLDQMFPAAVKYLTKLKDTSNYNYRYIDYDNFPGGTHNKIYSWILEKNVTPYCESMNGKNQGLEKNLNLDLFPRETPWESLLFNELEGELKGKLKNGPIY